MVRENGIKLAPCQEGRTIMDEWKEPYRILWRATSAAIEAIEQQNYGEAKQLLIAGQQDAEEMFMGEGEDGSGSGE
jgi:hypothetical protein